MIKRVSGEYFLIASIKKKTFEGENINVASGIETSISSALEIFANEIDKDIFIDFSGVAKKGDPTKWISDISLIKKMGFKPSYTLEMGLRNTVKWLKSHQ